MPDKPRFPKPAELAHLLSQASGETVTVAQIEADIAAGAPVTDEGEINVVFYVAWILSNEKFKHTKLGAK